MKAFVCKVAIAECTPNVDCGNIAHHVVGCDNRSILTVFAKLQYLSVYLSDSDRNCCQVNGLCDAGTEICLANFEVLQGLELNKIGYIFIHWPELFGMAMAERHFGTSVRSQGET
jgi:hypothetical protein